MRKTLATATLAVFSLAVLTGCSGASAQTVEQACDLAQDKMEAASTELQAQFGSLATGDFEGAAEAAAAGHDKILEVAKEVTNTEVHDAMVDFAGVFEGMGELMGKFQDAGTDVDKLTELTEEMTQFQTDLTDSATTFQELCGA